MVLYALTSTLLFKTIPSYIRHPPKPSTFAWDDPAKWAKERIVNDPAYYAEGAGVKLEDLVVETEDGFLLKCVPAFLPFPIRLFANTQSVLLVHGCLILASPLQPLISLSISLLLYLFISRLQRVVARNPKIHSDGRGGFPVLIMHGLFQSAGSFITSEERSLAFWLAQECVFSSPSILYPLFRIPLLLLLISPGGCMFGSLI
jgi:lysosomal acid lipase/cholesteryl ester hydrolase